MRSDWKVRQTSGDVRHCRSPDADWPTFRANNSSTATTAAEVPAAVQQSWQITLPTRCDAHGTDSRWHARVCRGLGWRRACAGRGFRPAEMGGLHRRRRATAPDDRGRPRIGRLGGRLGVRVGGRDRPAALAVPRRADRAPHSGLRPVVVDVAGGQRRVGRGCRGVCGGRDRELRRHACLCAGCGDRPDQVAEQ